jgi:pyrroline-5-carboxylate reductase
MQLAKQSVLSKADAIGVEDQQMDAELNTRHRITSNKGITLAALMLFH